MKTCLNEHKRCLKSHTSFRDRSQYFNKASDAANCPHYYYRKVREAVKIHKYPQKINRDVGYHLGAVWKTLIHPLTFSTLLSAIIVAIRASSVTLPDHQSPI